MANQPTEQQRADLSKRRGQVAAGITDSAARKAFIARQGQEEAKGSKDTSGLESELYRERNRQAAQGSFQKGGTVPRTGNYKLHKGEKVVPAPVMTDPAHALEKTSATKAAILRKDAADPRTSAFDRGSWNRAADQADAIAHGANGNMVHPKSSAIAPHDKDR